jgi:hypothetical protein
LPLAIYFENLKDFRKILDQLLDELKNIKCEVESTQHGGTLVLSCIRKLYCTRPVQTVQTVQTVPPRGPPVLERRAVSALQAFKPIPLLIPTTVQASAPPGGVLSIGMKKENKNGTDVTTYVLIINPSSSLKSLQSAITDAKSMFPKNIDSITASQGGKSNHSYLDKHNNNTKYVTTSRSIGIVKNGVTCNRKVWTNGKDRFFTKEKDSITGKYKFNNTKKSG